MRWTNGADTASHASEPQELACTQHLHAQLQGSMHMCWTLAATEHAACQLWHNFQAPAQHNRHMGYTQAAVNMATASQFKQGTNRVPDLEVAPRNSNTQQQSLETQQL